MSQAARRRRVVLLLAVLGAIELSGKGVADTLLDTCYIKGSFSARLSIQGDLNWVCIGDGALLGDRESVLVREDGGLICVDTLGLRRLASDGLQLWEIALPNPGELQAVVLPRRSSLVVCVWSTGLVMAFERSSGRTSTVFQLPTSGGCSASCLDLADDVLYIVSDQGNRLFAVAVEPDSMSLLWATDLRRAGSPAGAARPFGKSWCAQAATVFLEGTKYLVLAVEDRQRLGRCRLAFVSLDLYDGVGSVVSVRRIRGVRWVRRLLSSGDRCILLGQGSRWRVFEGDLVSTSEIDFTSYRSRGLDPIDVVLDGNSLIVEFLGKETKYNPEFTKGEPPPIHLAKYEAGDGEWVWVSSAVTGLAPSWQTTHLSRSGGGASVLREYGAQARALPD
ncbi:MAG: hypothetical protein MUE73_14960 [Planctomycetes bacterium]|nr:hypothetical protein [Planctomycetota bacterium]